MDRYQEDFNYSGISVFYIEYLKTKYHCDDTPERDRYFANVCAENIEYAISKLKDKLGHKAGSIEINITKIQECYSHLLI